VHYIASEDTRVTQKLLARYEIKTPCISVQKYNEAKRCHKIIEDLKSGYSIALVSDAGTPNIADPGAFLIKSVRQEGLPIFPIPGPSSLTAFLSVCGILSSSFYFAGFLPTKTSELETLITSLPENTPFVAFEAGTKLIKKLPLLHAIRKIKTLTIAKELTKIHETLITGTYDETQNLMNKLSPKGEWILLIEWEKTIPEIQTIVKDLKNIGLTPQQIRHIGTHHLHLPKNALYHSIHHD